MKKPLFAKKFLICFSLFVANILSLHLNADVYYVAVNGDDDNPGTITEPFETIPKALTVVQPGDTILIRQGTYPAFEVRDLQGTEENQIVIKAYPGEYVTIDRYLEGSTPYHGIHILGVCKYIIFEDFEITDTDTLIDYLRGFNLWNDAHLDTIRSYYDLMLNRDGIKINHNSTGEFHNHLTFKNLEIHHLMGNGIHGSDGDYLQFIDNHFYDLGWPRSGYGWYVNGDYNLFKDNLVYDCVYGFHVTWTNNSIFEGNVMYENGVRVYYHMSSDNRKWYGAGLYIWSDGSNNIIRNNIGYDNDSGIRLAGCEDCYIVNNTLYSNNFGVYLKEGDGNSGVIIRNNIGYQNTYDDFRIGSGNTVDHNLSGVNPLFVDRDNHDFHLQDDSPAIDAGVALPEVTVDIDGVPRPQENAYDIGAYEYHSGPIEDTEPPSPPQGVGVVRKYE